MRVLFAALIVCAIGCARTEPPEPETANSTPAAEKAAEVPVRPSPRAKPANLSAALSLAGLPAPPGVQDDGSGFALSPREDGRERLTATFSSTSSPSELGDFYIREAKLEPLGTGSDMQLAGKSPNGSDVIITLKQTGEGTTVDVRAILYE